VVPVPTPVEGVVAPTPPLVEPVLGVVVTGVVVGVVVAGVEVVEVEVVAAVEELLVATDVDPVVPIELVAPVEPVEPVELATSSGLRSTGTSAGTLAGASSETVVPPQAASAAALTVPPRSAIDRERRVTLTLRAGPCGARTSGSR
jgi:hypothetical protein